jgi:hypothetical protein
MSDGPLHADLCFSSSSMEYFCREKHIDMLPPIPVTSSCVIRLFLYSFNVLELDLLNCV